jgi:tetratricopeptide (TPR) repeat protein
MVKTPGGFQQNSGVCRPRRARAAGLSLSVLTCALLVPAHADQATLLWNHGAHTQPSTDERALRELLARYSAGALEAAVRGVLAKGPRWIPTALDAATRRTDEEIRYHRRPENRLSAARDERVERYLRADRLNVLLLAAALQLESSRAVADVNAVGWQVVGSERAIDRIYALRADFEQNGPLPWPIAMDEPWERVNRGVGEPQRSADWLAVRDFIRRWYAAAVSRLQGLVELRLAPALVTRGLVRFPADPDLLLARGSLVETRLALAQVDASLASLLYSSEIRRRWRDQLSDAARDFEQAVQSAGPASEAAVRLARVRLLEGQPERARDLLNRVLASDARVQLRYLALLFRAAAAEQSGDVQAATHDYEAAVDSMPGAQVPMLALGRIADEHNQPSDSRKWVERALSPETYAVDPWRRYIQGQAWQAADRVASLRTLEPR